MSEYNFTWADCTRISDDWINKHLIPHSEHSQNKLMVRTYSLKFSGTQYQITALIDTLADYIKEFVFGPEQVSKIEMDGKDVFRKAMHYFGDTNPESDGKYGELILFLFTESVLKAPLITHKMTLLTNTRDQVKGGDGIFFGKYKEKNALMIGESKIEGEVSKAITHALESLDRFHSNLLTTSQFNHELIMSSTFIRKDFTKEQLDYLYRSLTPGTEEYRSNLLAHPVLIIYEDEKIKDIEKQCEDNVQGETFFKQRLDKRIPEIIDSLKEKVDRYSSVSSLYLDFFFMPLSSVKNFRYTLYEEIHGVPYRP